MSAYYNEIDPFAAAWLRELIKREAIVPGEVDERSIEDVSPSEIRNFTQCHFFAGIGVWSYALRQSGWPDDRPIWTGSCPCQPFSAAGKRMGTSDERHLWPAFFHLIEACKPVTVIGEQVASKDGLAWLDLVQTDLEGSGYASGAVDTCAAGFGAPHIRQRLYWMAYANGGNASAEGLQRSGEYGQQPQDGSVSGMANSRSQSARRRLQRSAEGAKAGRVGASNESERSGAAVKLGDDNGTGLEGRGLSGANMERISSGKLSARSSGTSFWSDCDWLPCIDGKARPVEPGTFPLAHGIAARVGRLRGYGNALVAPQAQGFIEAVMEVIDGLSVS